MSLHKLSAGDGYTYLTRQVAAGDEALLEWADRDERDHGLGDAPYPPNFPKQEGEPPRVQPSRARNRSGET